MKKLLIATAVAASTIASGAHAALTTLNYDVAVSGVISGAAGGSTTGVGTAAIVLDLADLSQNGTFTMTVDTTINNTSPINISGIVGSQTVGAFDTMAFINTGQLNFVGGATNTVTSCTDIQSSWLGSVCGNTTVGDSAAFVIDPGTFTVANQGALVGFDVTDSRGTVAGNVTTVSSYTLTQAAPSEVPVPAAAWLFGSALVGLAGIGRKRKAS